MEDKPKVVIIIPIYNTGKYLRACVDSVFQQDFDDYSIILVDDGSPDNAPLICDELRKEHNNITVIHKENGGLSSARNAGLDYIDANKISPKYIFFLDSDDCIYKAAIQGLMEKAEDDSADIVFSDRYLQVDDKSKKKKVRYHFKNRANSISPKEFAIGVLIGQGRAWRAHGVLYSYEPIKKNHIRFPEGRVSEDFTFNINLLKCVQNISIYKGYTIEYTSREGSISNSYISDFEKDIFFIDEQAGKYIREVDIDVKKGEKKKRWATV